MSFYIYLVLPETEDITLYNDKSNNDSNSNIVLRNAMCFFLRSNIVLKIILNGLFEFKSKHKYERKMLIKLKRSLYK